MDEMRMLREYHDARPGPSSEVTAQARARLEERARTRERRFRVRRRYVLGVAAIGAAAVATVPLGGGSGGDQAYAAERLPDGRIKVTMDDLAGPPAIIERRLDRVERELAALGVKADIELIPSQTECSSVPRGDLDVEANRRASPVDDGWLLPHRDKRAIFYVHPERIKPGNTLVWTLAVTRAGGMTAVQLSLYQVRGPVKPCDPVPLGEIRPRLGGGG
ncbi:hypothetical protein [Actinomadura sp. NPDC000600]|uniref:hypothetical protein n=1 Tax=Actinomadura sp. NPDC000600 TaxID=3154262 RepID=UPI003398F92A